MIEKENRVLDKELNDFLCQLKKQIQEFERNHQVKLLFTSDEECCYLYEILNSGYVEWLKL